MKRIILLLLVMLSYSAWSADNWYVCPDSVNTATSTGTNYATDCFDGNADINWAAIDPGDTLYFCGDWLPTDARITVADSGTAGNYITLSGNAAACGRTENSSISREGVTGVNGQNMTASNTGATRQYIKIEDITFKHCADVCLLWDFSTLGAVTDNTDLWVNRVRFENCGTTGTPKCLRHSGENLLVENSTFRNTYGDAIWLKGGGVVIRDNEMSLLSNGGIGGDGIQIDATSVTNTGNVEIYRNQIDHSDVDVKYCILVAARGTSDVDIHDNTCYCPSVATNPTPAEHCHGITVDARTNTVLKVKRNFVRGGRIGISINGDPPSTTFATAAMIDGNIVTNAYDWGILTDGYVNNVDIFNNTVVSAGDTAIDVRKNSSDSPDAIDMGVQNNVMANSPLGFSYANQTPSPRGYNSFWGNDADVEANGVAGSTTTGDVTADPKLANEAVNSPSEACLQADSPLIGAGVWTSASVLDYYNRVMASPPNIGAMSNCGTRRTATNRRQAARFWE